LYNGRLYEGEVDRHALDQLTGVQGCLGMRCVSLQRTSHNIRERVGLDVELLGNPQCTGTGAPHSTGNVQSVMDLSSRTPSAGFGRHSGRCK